MSVEKRESSDSLTKKIEEIVWQKKDRRNILTNKDKRNPKTGTKRKQGQLRHGSRLLLRNYHV